MFDDLFKVSHAAGAFNIQPDAMTGADDFVIDGENYGTCGLTYEVTRNEYGNLTYKESKILLRDDDCDDYGPAGFGSTRTYRNGLSDTFGNITVATAAQTIENPVFQHLICVGNGSSFSHYFVRNYQDLAELLGKFRVLAESEQ